MGFYFPGKFLQYRTNTDASNGNRWDGDLLAPTIRYVYGDSYNPSGIIGWPNANGYHYATFDYGSGDADTDRGAVVLTSAVYYSSTELNTGLTGNVYDPSTNSIVTGSDIPMYIHDAASFNLNIIPIEVILDPASLATGMNRAYSDTCNKLMNWVRDQGHHTTDISHIEQVRIAFVSDADFTTNGNLNLNKPAVRDSIRYETLTNTVPVTFATIGTGVNNSKILRGTSGDRPYKNNRMYFGKPSSKNFIDASIEFNNGGYNEQEASELSYWIRHSSGSSGYLESEYIINNTISAEHFYENSEFNEKVFGSSWPVPGASGLYYVKERGLPLGDIEICLKNIKLTPSNPTNSIYLVVYTYFNYTCADLQTNIYYIPAYVEAYEIWGPIYVVIVPSSISLDFKSNWNKLGSASNYTGFEYKYPATVVYQSSSGVSYSSNNVKTSVYNLYIGDDENHVGTMIPVDERYFDSSIVSNKRRIVENVRMVTTEMLSDVQTGLIFKNSAYPANYDSSIFNITQYNAYRLYVYPGSDVTVNSNTGIANIPTDNHYSYTRDSSNNLTVNNVSIAPGTSCKLYVREVLEETYIHGDIELTRFIDFNPLYDPNGTLSFTHNTTPSVGHGISNVSVNMRKIAGEYIHAPAQDSPFISGLDYLITDSIYDGNTKNSICLYEITFDLSNNVTNSYIILNDSNDPSCNKLTINITRGTIYATDIDASLVKATDPTDATAVEYHLDESSAPSCYIPWTPDDYEYNDSDPTDPLLLWLKIDFAPAGVTDTSFTISIDTIDSIDFNDLDTGPSRTGNIINSPEEISFIVNGPGVTTVTITSGDGQVEEEYNVIIYTPVDSIEFTGGKASTPSSNDSPIDVGTPGSPVVLWSIPDDYHIDDTNDPRIKNLWQNSVYRVNAKFKDSAGNVINYSGMGSGTLYSKLYTHFYLDGFGTNINDTSAGYFGGTFIYYRNISYSNVITNSSNRIFDYSPTQQYSEAESGIATFYLFPGDASNNDYPWPSSGTTPVTAGVYGKLPTDYAVSESFNVQVKKTTTSLGGTISSGPYTAGTSFTIPLSKNGDESWADLNLTVNCYNGTFDSDHTPIVSISGSIATVTFPLSMPSAWTGQLEVTGVNHYDKPITTGPIPSTGTITVNPAVSSLSISYKGSVVATSGNPGNLGIVWYNDNSSHQTTLLSLVGTVNNGTIDYSCDPSTNMSFGGTGYASGASVSAIRLNTQTRNAAGTSYDLIAKSSITPNDVSTYVTVTPKKITDTISITSSDSGTPKISGQTFTFTIDLNGDEDLSAYAAGSSYPFTFEDANAAGNEIPISDVIGPLVSVSNPSTGSLGGTQQITYVFTVNNAIATDHNINIFANLPVYDETDEQYATSANSVNLVINKSEASSIVLYDSNNNVISGTNIVRWYETITIRLPYNFYGIVSGQSLSDDLKHINYAKSSGTDIEFANNERLNIPSGSENGTVGVGFISELNTNRTTYTITGTSVQTGSVYSSFTYTPLRISTSLSALLTNSTITVGTAVASTELSVTIDGDEELDINTLLPLQYAVNSQSAGTSVPPEITVGTPVISNNSRTVTYPISTNNVTSTATIDITASFIPHGGTSADTLTSTVTLIVKPAAGAFSIDASIDKSVVYGTEPATIPVTKGASLSTYKIEVPGDTAGSEVVEYSLDGGSTWNSLTTTGNSSTTVLVRRKSGDTKATFNIVLTAEQSDSGDTLDSTSVSLTLGIITYEGAINENVYRGGTATLNAVFDPVLTSDISSACWSSNGSYFSHSLSNHNLTNVVTVQQNAPAGNNTITFTYPGDGNNYSTHQFNINVLLDANDTFSLDPSTKILEWINGNVTGIYDVLCGTNIDKSTIQLTYSYDKSGYLSNPTLNVSANPYPTVTVSSLQEPTAGTVNGTLSLTASTIGGRNVSTSGTVVLKNGNSDKVFEANHSSVTLDGRSGQSGTFQITCNHKAGTQIVDDKANVTIASNSGSSWLNASYSTSTGVLTVTTRSARYSTDRTATIVLNSTVTGTSQQHDPLTLTVTQKRLITEKHFNVSSGSASIFESYDSTSGTIRYKTNPSTAADQLKEIEMDCYYIERNDDNTYNRRVDGSSYSIYSSSGINWLDNVSVVANTTKLRCNCTSVNTSTSERTGTVVLRTAFPDTQVSGELDFTITFVQAGSTYSDFVLKVDGNSSNFTQNMSSNSGTASLPVVCSYKLTQDGNTSVISPVNWGASKGTGEWYSINANTTTNVLTIQVQTNTTSGQRTSTITVSSTFNGYGSKSLTISLKQRAANIEFDPTDITLDPDANDIALGRVSVDVHDSASEWYVILPTQNSFISNVYNASNSSVVGSGNKKTGNSQIRVTLSGQNMQSGVDYVKYRKNIAARTNDMQIFAVDRGEVTSTFTVNQNGYSWTNSCVSSPMSLSYSASETEKTFTVNTNYDVSIGPNNTSVQHELTMVTSGYSLTGNKFADNEGLDSNTGVVKSKTFTCKLKLFTNSTTSRREGTILLQQIVHGQENTFSTVEIPFAQAAPTAADRNQLKLLDNNRNVVSTTISLTADATDLNYIVHSKLSSWSLSSDVPWIKINGESSISHSFPTATYESVEEIPATIAIESYTSTDNAREGHITLTCTETQSSVIYTVTQAKADVYYKVLRDNNYQDNMNVIREAFTHETVRTTYAAPISLDPNDLDTSSHEFVYYIQYFRGTTKSNMSIENKQNCTTTWTTKTGENLTDVEAIYKLVIEVEANPYTEEKNIYVDLTQNAGITGMAQRFSAKQSASVYDINDGIAATVTGYFGILNTETNPPVYIIPVTGDTYNGTVKVTNLLQYDSIKILNARFSELEGNADYPISGGSWGTISYSNGGIIGPEKDMNLDIIINPYTLNENQENKEQYTEGINKKYYAITIECCTMSKESSTKDFNLMRDDNPNLQFIAVQNSLDVLQEKSWKLISRAVSDEESEKVYFIGDFTSEITTQLYSQDTGFVVKQQGTVSADNEVQTIKDIVNSNDILLDERFGTK